MNYRRCDVVDHGRYTVVDIRCEIASRLLLLCAHHASAQICQHAVVMQPSSSQALCALGEAMLHSYDNMKPDRKATAGDSSEAEVALKSAQMSFRASIDMEGKPAVSRGETDLDFISCHLYYDQHSYSCAIFAAAVWKVGHHNIVLEAYFKHMRRIQHIACWSLQYKSFSYATVMRQSPSAVSISHAHIIF